MRVEVDISHLEDQERAAIRSLEAQPAGMKRILDATAAEEVDTHVYNNITGRLEASTYAGPLEVTGDVATVEYGARMEYASNVVDRGRSRVVELASRAEAEIDAFFHGEADKIAAS